MTARPGSADVEALAVAGPDGLGALHRAVAGAGGRPLAVATPPGLWVLPMPADGKVLAATLAIAEANLAIEAAAGLASAPVARIVADRPTLAACVEAAVRQGGQLIKPTHDVAHVEILKTQPGLLQICETMPALHLFAADILEFLLPNHAAEMALTEEIAESAISAGKPAIAFRAFAEAFRTNPFFALQPYFRDQFEMAALLAEGAQGGAAGDGSGTGGAAGDGRGGADPVEVFFRLTDTARLPALPDIARGFRIRVCFPAGDPVMAERADPPIEVNPGYEDEKILVCLGGLLMGSVTRKEIPQSWQQRHHADLAVAYLKACWSRSGPVQRMRFEIGCLNRFGAALSMLGLVDPPVPEAIVAHQGLQAGLPPRQAMAPLLKRLRDHENA